MLTIGLICVIIISIIDIGTELFFAFALPDSGVLVWSGAIFVELDGVMFAVLTVALIVTTCSVFSRINTKFRLRPVIKDKCAIGTMTTIFTFSYLLRTVYLMSQIFIDPGEKCEPEIIYMDYALLLSLLPLFDIFPILVVFVYHIITLKNSKNPKQGPDESLMINTSSDMDTSVLTRIEKRLYSIDDGSPIIETYMDRETNLTDEEFRVRKESVNTIRTTPRTSNAE
jgi:magnesium-transporting ATPase (P-type)